MAWISNNYGFEVESDVFLQKVSIHQLSPELSQVLIVGTVIAKQGVRRIMSKKQPGSERYVLNFTIRDSPTDTINAVCWGDEAGVKKMSSGFTIGDVVKIRNPQIIEKQTELQDDKFSPPTSRLSTAIPPLNFTDPLLHTQFILNLSSSYSEVIISPEESEYAKLINCPLHNSSNLISLADVIYNCQNNADGLTINLLVAVKDIKGLQTLKTKTGKEIKKMMLIVFDQTHSAFPVVIWDEETANFISKYCTRRTVILITDIRVSYNAFMKEIAATAGSTTVFTPNPDVPERRVLYQYAMKMVMANENNTLKQSDPSKVYKVSEINNIMDSSEMEVDEFEGTVCAALTSFDIDGHSRIFSLRCPGCYVILEKPEDKCTNGACEIGSGMKCSPPEEMYDIAISLTDETANLDKCLLSGQVAENLLGVNVKGFNGLSSEEKTAIKWKFLFQRFYVHFKISHSAGNGRLLLRIMQMNEEK